MKAESSQGIRTQNPPYKKKLFPALLIFLLVGSIIVMAYSRYGGKAEPYLVPLEREIFPIRNGVLSLPYPRIVPLSDRRLLLVQIQLDCRGEMPKEIEQYSDWADLDEGVREKDYTYKRGYYQMTSRRLADIFEVLWEDGDELAPVYRTEPGTYYLFLSQRDCRRALNYLRVRVNGEHGGHSEQEGQITPSRQFEQLAELEPGLILKAADANRPAAGNAFGRSQIEALEENPSFRKELSQYPQWNG